MEKFLGEKYKDLAFSKPVERAVRKKGENPLDSEKRIDIYLSRLEEISKKERGFHLLKEKILEENITKFEDIPKEYLIFQEKIISQREGLSNWQRIPKEEREKIKREKIEEALKDQRASLEQWIDYFISDDSSHIPKELKYWIFRDIIHMQEYDGKRKKFPIRSKGTVKKFPDINEKALEFIVNALNKKKQGKDIELKYDISPEEEEKFKKSLQGANFRELYSFANELIAPIQEEILLTKEGVWKKYKKDDFETLANSIRGKGTGWCIAGENTAALYLKDSDLDVFYSNDEKGNPTIPRIAIRLKGKKIVEIRGRGEEQNLDPYIGNILSEKLESSDFENKKENIKKEKDTRKLADLQRKIKENVELNQEDLIFLYEIEKKIEGFGLSDDPAIEEIKSKRDKISDYCTIFNCKKEQIVEKISDINEDSKVYTGDLHPENYRVLSERKNPIMIDGRVILQNETKFKSIPEGTIFNKDVNFDNCISLSSIPKGTIFNGNAYFFDVALLSIDDDVKFNGDAYFDGFNLSNEIREKLKKMKEEGKITGKLVFESPMLD